MIRGYTDIVCTWLNIQKHICRGPGVRPSAMHSDGLALATAAARTAAAPLYAAAAAEAARRLQRWHEDEVRHCTPARAGFRASPAPCPPNQQHDLCAVPRCAIGTAFRCVRRSTRGNARCAAARASPGGNAVGRAALIHCNAQRQRVAGAGRNDQHHA